MKKIKILGISASPRKNANTDYMVQMALLAARQIKGVETEFLRLRDYNLKSGCISCYTCDRNRDREELLCRGVKDDFNIILKKEMEANGFIWGSPVYIGGVSWLWKVWMDRHECMPLADCNRNKPVGCVTVGVCRAGGQAQAIEDMFRAAYWFDMIPIGAEVAGAYLASAGINGACGISAGWPETEGGDVFKAEAKQWIKYDRLAISNCLVIGERVAEMAKVIEAGFTVVNPENGETRWPVHGKPKEQYYYDLLDEYERKGIIPRIEARGARLTYTPRRPGIDF